LILPSYEVSTQRTCPCSAKKINIAIINFFQKNFSWNPLQFISENLWAK
jgi:hypothetical protein